jgi:WhiB family redox-sensing transcriptional regulator
MAVAWDRFEETAELTGRAGGSPGDVFDVPDLLTPWRPRWWDDADCRGRPDVDFFAADAAPALAVCAACPVHRECGDWAATLNIRHGVFGGLTPKERRREKDRRPRLNAVRAKAVRSHLLGGVFGPAADKRRGEERRMDEQEKRRRNALARSKAVKELTRRHLDEFRAIYAAEKEAAGLEREVRPRRTA